MFNLFKKKEDLEATAASATTFADWEYIAKKAGSNSELRNRAVQNMFGFAKTLPEWRLVNRLLEDDSPYRTTAIEQVCKLVTDNKTWEDIFKNEYGPLKTRALQGLIDTADTVEQLYFVCKELDNGSEIKKQLIGKMVEKAQILADWMLVYDVSEPGSEQEKLAVDEIGKIVIDYGTWKNIYDEVSGPLADRALHGMIDTADDVDDLRCVYGLVDSDSDEEKMLIEKIASKVIDYNTWENIYEYESGALETRALQGMIDTADDVDDLRELYGMVESGSSQEAAVVEKIGIKVEDYDTWRDIYENESGALETRALQGMIDTADIVEYLLDIYEDIDEDSEEAKKVTEKIAGQVYDYNTWSEIYDGYGGPLETRALQGMADTASTVDDLVDTYNILEEGSEEAKKIIEKISDMVTDADTWEDVYDTVNSDSELEAKASTMMDSLRSEDSDN